MDKKWAEANNAVEPTPAAATTPSFASLNANGTGAFTVESHQPGVKTVFKANPNWWRKPEHNIKEIIFTPIGSDATRVAALLSGEVDIIEPVPIQDISRVDSSPTRKCSRDRKFAPSSSAWTRLRDELLYSNVKGKNPFKDVRVREAFFKAIDIELIKTRVMRGLSTPSALMIAPQLFPLSKDFTRPKFDPDGAKKLLTEAGYPDGFEVTMDCPNDRYVNDAAICQAVVGMLARIGVKVNLLAQPKAQYFAKVLKPGGYQTSFYPARLDARHARLPQRALRHHGLPRRSESPAAARPISAATATRRWMNLPTRCWWKPDTAKRDQLIKEAFEIASQGFRLYPAASAGAGVGRVEESEIDAARRQPGPALLGNQTGLDRLQHQVPAASAASGTFRFQATATSATPSRRESERNPCSLSLFAAPSRPSAS